MNASCPLRDRRVIMIAGAALLHATAGLAAFVSIPPGVETRLDRPLEVSFAPAPQSDPLDRRSAPLAPKLTSQNETTPVEQAEPASEPSKPRAETKLVESRPEPSPQLVSPSPEVLTARHAQTEVAVAPAAGHATPLSAPEPPRRETMAKPRKRPQAKKLVRPKPVNDTKLASLPKPLPLARNGGDGAVSDAGTSQDAKTSGATSRDYGALVLAQIRARLRFPDEARSRGVEGVAAISFVVSGQGAVEAVRLARSSGDAALDAAALSLVRGLSLPPPPDRRFVATVPVRYAFRK